MLRGFIAQIPASERLGSAHEPIGLGQEGLTHEELLRVQRSAKARGSLTVCLDKSMQWFATASGKRGRSLRYSEAAIEFCLTIKCLFGLALRQTLGLVQSLLKLAGLDWPEPDFSTVCRRQKTYMCTCYYQASQGALKLLMDSSGIKFLGEGE